MEQRAGMYRQLPISRADLKILLQQFDMNDARQVLEVLHRVKQRIISDTMAEHVQDSSDAGKVRDHHDDQSG